jgi:hypothetical protein
MLTFRVSLLAFAVWTLSSPGFAWPLPVSLVDTDSLTDVGEKVVQIRGRKRRAVTAEERKAAKAWAEAKRSPAGGSGSRTSEATRRALDQLLLRDALRGVRCR